MDDAVLFCRSNRRLSDERAIPVARRESKQGSEGEQELKVSFILPANTEDGGDGSGNTWRRSNSAPSEPEGPNLEPQSQYRQMYRRWRVGDHSGADSATAAYSPPMIEDGIPNSDSEEEIRWSRVSSTRPFVIEEGKPGQEPFLARSLSPPQRLEMRERSMHIAANRTSLPESAFNRYSTENVKKTSIPKSVSASDLQNLAHVGYFPAQPEEVLVSTQKSLKASVIGDMCQAVAKHIVGESFINSISPTSGAPRRVVNHLYKPILQAVERHFSLLPARYALSVDPTDVNLHIKLMTRLARDDVDIAVHVKEAKRDNGTVIPNQCEVTIVTADQDDLLDSITSALRALKGRVLDADVMTTTTGIALDRFVVACDSTDLLSPEWERGLKAEIAKQISRSSTGSPSIDLADLKQRQSEPDFVKALNNQWSIELDEIKLMQPVGSGRSGQTYVAQWRGKIVAAKVVTAVQRGGINSEILSELWKEIEVVCTLRHPNICLFLGAAMVPPTYCLVYEFMEGGTLTSMLRGGKVLIDFFRLATEISQGMNYLHLCHVIHRDLKSGNLLLDKHGTVKVSDFGLSCIYDNDQSGEMTAETGTYRWMAPEVIRHEPYSKKADVYSFAIVMWEMIVKDQPFKGMTPIQAAFAVARQQVRPALPAYTPPKLVELVELCWHENPSMRPSFAEVLQLLPEVQRSLKKKDYVMLGFKRP